MARTGKGRRQTGSAQLPDFGAKTAPRKPARRARPERDRQPLLTLTLSGAAGEQFDVLMDGRAYWGGNESPYRFEMRLERGAHELRICQRHAMDKQPSEFVPLIFAMLLSDGRISEYGPYFAALDARININADNHIKVDYAVENRSRRSAGQAKFKCSAGRGIEFEVRTVSISTDPRIRRRWHIVNWTAFAVFAVMALAVMIFGALACVASEGPVGGGIAAIAVGMAMAAGCTMLCAALCSAARGELAPHIAPMSAAGRGDISPPPSR